MSSSAGGSLRRILHAVAILLGVGVGFGSIAVAEPPGATRGFADKLRYGPGVKNHPVRVRPSETTSVPKGWPVGLDGSITCLTCHTHLPSLGGGDSPNLREFEGTGSGRQQFCGQCHLARERRSAKGMHWRAMPFAHVKADHSANEELNLGLDRQSRTCLECHDGVTASESRNTLGSSIISDAWDAKRSHPVGVRYADPLNNTRGSALAPVRTLPPQVQLPGGNVSCESCHNLYGTGRDLLTVPIEGSALCFTCHSGK